jgi:hypothetical protein
MELIKLLVNQLGVSDEQATGGAGLIFKLVKDRLGAGDFGQVKNVLPGVDDLIDSAPKAKGVGGMLGGLASSLGGGAGKLGGLASLAGGFKKLDMDSGMIQKFIPVVTSFLQSKGGDSVKDLLANVLK